MQAILVAEYSFEDNAIWNDISRPAKSFIAHCLTVDPGRRITAHEALDHPWIAGEGEAAPNDLLPAIKKNFNARRTLHAAIDTIRAINQLRAGGGAAMGMQNKQQYPPPQQQQQQNGVQQNGAQSGAQEAASMRMDGLEGPGAWNQPDPRGHARGQNDEQIHEQQRRIHQAMQQTQPLTADSMV